MNIYKKKRLGKSARRLRNILLLCVIIAEYTLAALLHARLIDPSTFFLHAYELRESFYITVVLILGGVLLADIEEGHHKDP